MCTIFLGLITSYKGTVLTWFSLTYLEVAEAVVLLAVQLIRLVGTVWDRVAPGVAWNAPSPCAGPIDTLHLVCVTIRIKNSCVNAKICLTFQAWQTTITQKSEKINNYCLEGFSLLTTAL